MRKILHKDGRNPPDSGLRCQVQWLWAAPVVAYRTVPLRSVVSGLLPQSAISYRSMRSLARTNTSASIEGVSLPMFVLWRLG